MGCFHELFFLRRHLRHVLKVETMIGINGTLLIRHGNFGQTCPATAAENIARTGNETATATNMRQCAAACPAENITRRVDVITVHDFSTALTALISAIYSPQVSLIALCSSSAVVFFRM